MKPLVTRHLCFYPNILHQDWKDNQNISGNLWLHSSTAVKYWPFRWFYFDFNKPNSEFEYIWGHTFDIKYYFVQFKAKLGAANGCGMNTHSETGWVTNVNSYCGLVFGGETLLSKTWRRERASISQSTVSEVHSSNDWEDKQSRTKP